MPRTVYSVDAHKAAKHLGIGRNTLLKLLRDAGYTHAHAPRKNLPKRQYRQAGLFASALTEMRFGSVRRLHEKLTITAAGLDVCRELIEEQKKEIA